MQGEYFALFDARNLERYERHADEFGVYGVFELPGV